MLLHPTRFWNFMARGYSRKPVDNPEAYQHKLDETAKYLTKDDRVLEFGCGTGTTAMIHAPRVFHIDAIDFSSEMIAIAREKAEAQNIKNVRFEVSSFEDWPIPNPDGDYDAVLGMSILHLVSNLDETLSKVHQALKPGGMFFSSTVCIGKMNPVVRFGLSTLGGIGILPKILPLTPDSLKEIIAKQGFKIVTVWQPEESAAVFIVTRRPR